MFVLSSVSAVIRNAPNARVKKEAAFFFSSNQSSLEDYF